MIFLPVESRTSLPPPTRSILVHVSSHSHLDGRRQSEKVLSPFSGKHHENRHTPSGVQLPRFEVPTPVDHGFVTVVSNTLCKNALIDILSPAHVRSALVFIIFRPLKTVHRVLHRFEIQQTEDIYRHRSC
jgi:hypothetical protein